MTVSPESTPPRLRGLFILCCLTLGWAVLVLQAGGFTTSIHAGMAFLDWPLSNGSVNPPGWLTEIDKFAEHSHRLAASGLGLFCIAITLWHWRCETRPTVRKLAYVLLGLVILQGGLGGLRVLLDRLNIGGEGNLKAVSFAIAHALNAQLTIAVLALLALLHSKTCRNETASAPSPTRTLGRFALLAVFSVILMGAVMRQNHFTSWVNQGAVSDLFIPAGVGLGWWINLAHRSGALVAALAVIGFATSGNTPVRRWLPLGLLLGLQIGLGVLSIQLPLNPHVRTVHLVVGAALFSTLCAQVALAHRRTECFQNL